MTQISGQSYEQFIKAMNNAGIKTTGLANGEANFADYGNALSASLQQRIVDSFDCEQDYELQSQIAGLFTNTNVMQSGDFTSACKSLGLNVSVSYESTSYISDYKAGNFSNSVGNGAIAVYTISDGKGGKIVIADANGNAALESEELFMNQILGDINYEISANKNVGSGIASNNAVSEISNETEKKDEEVSQNDYNEVVEKYLEKGYTKEEAVKKADIELKVYNMIYTGTMQEQVEEEEVVAA